jgi:hypothetical protein
MDTLLPILFVAALVLNVRASFKLGLDWRGMLTTVRFVREAYARRSALPTEEALEHDSQAPVFLHLVPAYHEPDIAGTVKALCVSRYPHSGLHVVVVTKEEEERAPHPAMGVSTGELVRRFHEALPPYQQKRLAHLVMPGPGRKAQQLNWALRPEALREILGDSFDPSRVFVGVSDADSIPDPDTYRWIAARELAGQGSLAYQGITLSLANYARLDIRGKICAIQQSSIFIRVSIARLINEVKRVRLFDGFRARFPRLGRLARPAFELCFRRSQICLGHNQFVRLDVMQSLGGFHARLRAGRPRHPDPGDADDRADGPARDARQDDPPECALVRGRARRRSVPAAHVPRAALGLQPGPAGAPRRQQGR